MASKSIILHSKTKALADWNSSHIRKKTMASPRKYFATVACHQARQNSKQKAPQAWNVPDVKQKIMQSQRKSLEALACIQIQKLSKANDRADSNKARLVYHHGTGNQGVEDCCDIHITSASMVWPCSSTAKSVVGCNHNNDLEPAIRPLPPSSAVCDGDPTA
jgi:hypothetical protein